MRDAVVKARFGYKEPDTFDKDWRERLETEQRLRLYRIPLPNNGTAMGKNNFKSYDHVLS